MIEIWILNIFSTLLFSSIFIIVPLINCSKKKDPPANPQPAATTPAPANPASVAAKSVDPKKAEDLKPQVFEKNEKEKKIAEGQLKRNKHDYPTMDDVLSDWETEEDGGGEGGKKKKKKGDEKKDGDPKDAEKKPDEKIKSKMDGEGAKKSEKQ